MKIILSKLFRGSGFSLLKLRLPVQICRAVDAWVEEKGYIRPLHSVEDIAADIGIPAGQLGIYVRVWHRMSVLSWRKMLRIREAQHLLLDCPDLPVSVIGELVGIDDKSNFKRQFAQVAGVSPRVWRERHMR